MQNELFKKLKFAKVIKIKTLRKYLKMATNKMDNFDKYVQKGTYVQNISTKSRHFL